MAGYEYPRTVRHSTKFNGCIKLIKLDDRDPVKYYNQRSRRVEIKPEGQKLTTNCNEYHHNPIGFQSSSASLTLEAPITSPSSFNELDLKFCLRTFSQSARVLTSHNINDSRELVLNAILRNGKIAVTFWCRQRDEYQEATISSDIIVSNGNWHDIEIKVTATELRVNINYQEILKNSNFSIITARDLMSGQQIYRFGEYRSEKGFLGCVDGIRLQNKTFHDVFDNQNLFVINSKYIKESCTLVDQCFPNPCQNGASCVRNEHVNEARCNCNDTEFYGRYCDRSLYKPSCDAYQRFGLNESSYCLVDPDGRGPSQPYTSFCRVSPESNVVSTVVQHNMKQEFDGTNGDNKFLKFLKLTFHALNYDLDPENIKTIIKNSDRCRQKVVFKCRNTGLFNTPSGPPNVLWTNSVGVVRSYWGNVPSRSGCECQLTGGCSDPTKMCNCDALSDNWSEDRGYITEKTDLPISRIDVTDVVQYGRTGIYIGPLECFGLKHDNSEHFTDRNIFNDQNLLSKVCFSAEKKKNLIKMANQNENEKLQSEKPFLVTTISPIESPGNIDSKKGNTNIDLPPSNLVINEELSNSLTVYEIVLISIAAVATLTIIAKFILCHVFKRIHGQVTLNHDKRFDEPHSLFTTGDVGGTSSTSLKKQNGVSSYVKSPTNYWV